MSVKLDVNGIKEILGLWISESDVKHNRMQIFDELKAQGLQGFYCSVQKVPWCTRLKATEAEFERFKQA